MIWDSKHKYLHGCCWRKSQRITEVRRIQPLRPTNACTSYFFYTFQDHIEIQLNTAEQTEHVCVHTGLILMKIQSVCTIKGRWSSRRKRTQPIFNSIVGICQPMAGGGPAPLQAAHNVFDRYLSCTNKQAEMFPRLIIVKVQSIPPPKTFCTDCVTSFHYDWIAGQSPVQTVITNTTDAGMAFLPVKSWWMFRYFTG